LARVQRIDVGSQRMINFNHSCLGCEDEYVENYSLLHWMSDVSVKAEASGKIVWDSCGVFLRPMRHHGELPS